MPTPRKSTAPTTAAIDHFCAHFDDLFARFAERTALRQYLIGLLLPREHNKTLVELGAIVPGANRQALHHFMHDSPWDLEALHRRRLARWQAHPYLGPHAGGVLIVDETGDPKRGHRIVLAAQQYLGKVGHVANGVVAVTSHWTDGTRHVPVGVKPYRPASRLPKGKADGSLSHQTGPGLDADQGSAGGQDSLSAGGRRQCLRRECAARVSVVCGPHPVYHGTAALAWNLAVGRGSQAPASLHPRRSGESACPNGQ